MKKTFQLALATAAIAATSACGAGTAGTAAESPANVPASPPALAPAAAQPVAAPFGPACSAVPTDGEGSFTGMADDPVATAASNNPVLSTLVTAVKKAGLVDTLNSAKDITVFAPTDDAFAAIPKDQLDKVLADKETLTKILTYHVVQGRLAPPALPGATPATLQGGTLAVTGTGEDLSVNEAKVVCGGVQTGNATVYIIDKVLMPM
ncbi:fasciclin domain-containing protein [Herbidospora cretacea]|uniref:fasciclin domain-containing protein n=1 Tax=Herbidospora cretacea TaxID=28444 RepID=UPI0007734DF6|nr:fasciclin domain-containing protein [Herbidospora cretacea]